MLMPRPLPCLIVKKGSKDVLQNVGRDTASGVAEEDLDAVGVGKLAGGNGDASAVGRCLGSVDQQVYQHLGELIG
jgi:hypothetical protein